METVSSHKSQVESVAPGITIETDEHEEKALVRRIDMLLMPPLWLMYLFSYADRTNIGNAKVAGMVKDLHMSSNDYSLALVLFFVSYIIFEIPSNLALSKTRPSRYLPTIMVLWGSVTCCMAAVRNSSELLGVRFILGMLEAGYAPGVSLMLSSWYKKEEQAKRFSVFYSAAVLSGAFGGIVSGAITGSLDGARGIAGWRWLFIVEGAATICCAILASLILPDFPANTKRLSEQQRKLAVERLRVDQVRIRTAHDVHLTSLEALKASLGNWRTWLLTVGYMAMGASATMSYFYPTLVAGLGYTSVTAQYMIVPIYAVAFCAVLITGIFNDKYAHLRGVTIACWLALATICSIVVCAVYNYTARYVLLVFIATGLLTANASSLAYASSTLGGMRQEARAVSLAFINAMAGISGIYGAYLFPEDDSPKYLMGFGVVAGFGALAVVIYSAAHVLFRKYPLHAELYDP